MLLPLFVDAPAYLFLCLAPCPHLHPYSPSFTLILLHTHHQNRNVFESTLFLLVAHSFDVGDLLDIEGVMYRVRKITLLYSVRQGMRGGVWWWCGGGGVRNLNTTNVNNPVMTATSMTSN